MAKALKLPIWSTVFGSFGFCFRNLKLFAIVALIPFLMSVTVKLVGPILNGGIVANPTIMMEFIQLLAEFFVALMDMFYFFIFIIAWHCVFLRPNLIEKKG